MRFLCGQLFGMAAGEDGEEKSSFQEATQHADHVHRAWMCLQCGGDVGLASYPLSRNPTSKARKYLHMFKLYMQLLKLYSHDLVFATVKLICYLNGFSFNPC